MRRLGANFAGRAMVLGISLISLLLFLVGCVASRPAQPQSPLSGTPVAPVPGEPTIPVTSLATASAAQAPAFASPLTSAQSSEARAPVQTAASVAATPATTPALPTGVVRQNSAATSPLPVPSATGVPGPRGDVQVALSTLIQGLNRPVSVTSAGDGSGRLFVVEKPGVILVWDAGRLLTAPFLDIRQRVGSRGSEQGLLGMAFSPDYRTSGLFFVDYTDRNGNTVVSRFHVTGDLNVADPASEFKVLGIDQPAANHNGGDLVFGPDGYLWIGTGDGGGEYDRFGSGQNPHTLLAKMLRLDVTSDPSKPYTIPVDNPWVNAKWNGQDIPPEVWAVGLRNPWRYSFDRSTGDLWIADVGQDMYEEINRVPAGPGGKLQDGLNFGWSIMEGMHCFPDSASCQQSGLTMPVWEYQHGENGCSITGGYVYRGKAVAGLAGAYIYGDYCSGRIWALTQGANGAWQSQLLLSTGLAISSFGEDEAGELYVADLAGGVVYQLVAG